MKWFLVLLALAGCSSMNSVTITRPDGTQIVAQSTKAQNEESAKWTIKLSPEGDLVLDLGTKGTTAVNLTADVLDRIVSLIPAK